MSEPTQLLLLTALIFFGALIYSSGGHGGGTAYLAAMALFGLAPAVMRPTALVLNIAVTVIGTVRLARAGAVPVRLLLPLLLGSVPAAFVGGTVHLSAELYRPVLGGLLLLAAVRLWLPDPKEREVKAVSWPVLLTAGIALGFMAGLTGIGGGIFLSPLLLLAGWETPRRTAGAASVFILVNSVAGLSGQLASLSQLPWQVTVFGAAVVVGGGIGSYLGVHRLTPPGLRRVNAVVILFSGGKLLLESLK